MLSLSCTIMVEVERWSGVAAAEDRLSSIALNKTMRWVRLVYSTRTFVVDVSKQQITFSLKKYSSWFSVIGYWWELSATDSLYGGSSSWSFPRAGLGGSKFVIISCLSIEVQLWTAVRSKEEDKLVFINGSLWFFYVWKCFRNLCLFPDNSCGRYGQTSTTATLICTYCGQSLYSLTHTHLSCCTAAVKRPRLPIGASSLINSEVLCVVFLVNMYMYAPPILL